MSLNLDFSKEHKNLSKEETYIALNAYLENAAFVGSMAERLQWEVLERNLKDSPFIEETYRRVLQERTEELNKRNTFGARLDIKINHLEGNKKDAPSDQKQKKTLKQKVKKLFNDSRAGLYLAVGAVSAAVVAGGAIGLSVFGGVNGIDPRFCGSLILNGAVIGGKVLAVGGVLTTARTALSAAAANKGGEELLEAKEALANLKYLRSAFNRIEQADKFNKNKASVQEKADKPVSLQTAISNQAKKPLPAAVAEKINAQKSY
ncbi:MAG: hypothetical protein IJ752_08265 [Alphaproteobacteria bacterium]|nr:hypothetical protein [Alphaproteobacteria bacterium]